MEKVHVIKTSRFRQTVIRLYFPFEDRGEESLIRMILSKLMSRYSAKYPTVESLNKALIENYIYDIKYGYFFKGHQAFMRVTMFVPEEKYLGEEVFENACKFLFDAVYNPKLKDGLFDAEDFEREKKFKKIGFEDDIKNIDGYSSMRVYEELDPDFLGYSPLSHPEVFDITTLEAVSDFYMKHIGTKSPYVFVLGNMDEDKVSKVIGDCLDKNKPYEKFNHSLTHPLKINKRVKEINEKGPFNQSMLKMVYKVDNMRREDEDLLGLLVDLLSLGTTGILFKKVREERGLVYSVNSSYSMDSGILIISAKISRHNKEAAILAIKDSIDSINGDLLEDSLIKVKKSMALDLEYDKDSKMAIINDETDVYFGLGTSFAEDYKRCLAITPLDIVKFVKRLNLDMIYFLEGEKE